MVRQPVHQQLNKWHLQITSMQRLLAKAKRKIKQYEAKGNKEEVEDGVRQAGEDLTLVYASLEREIEKLSDMMDEFEDVDDDEQQKVYRQKQGVWNKQKAKVTAAYRKLRSTL